MFPLSSLTQFLSEKQEMFEVSMVYIDGTSSCYIVRHCLNHTKEDGAWCEVVRSLEKPPLKESW